MNTPKYYSENKVFFLQPLGEGQHSNQYQSFEHTYQVVTNPDDERVIRHNDPLSVVLQGVRLPEDLPGSTRDIAVVLDIHTSGERGLISLVAFYQRDVPAGQMLNFNNLLVYADPMWDSANPPYFRVRVLDVAAERNRQTGAILSKVSNLSAQIGSVVPHPVIPLVTSAIDAANLLLSNQRNVVLLDFQVQFYSPEQVRGAGGASLGPLLAGPWVVMGRAKGEGSGFWNRALELDRKTDRILDASTAIKTNVPVPYVCVALVKADAEVPKMVMDRSESLISLLSTPSAKSDVDALDGVRDNIISAITAFSLERRLKKYQTKQDLQDVINRFADSENGTGLNNNEQRRLYYVLNALCDPGPGYSSAGEWVKWWEEAGSKGRFVQSTNGPPRMVWKWEPAPQ